MEDMAEKISELLNDPEGMQRIKGMASALFGEDNNQKSKNDVCRSSPQGDAFQDIDMAQIMRIISAIKNTKKDSRTTLLLALKPHLSPEKGERVDNAVKILKIISVLPVLKDQGILNLF